MKTFKKFLGLFALSLSACVSIKPTSDEAARQFAEVGIGYGAVNGVIRADQNGSDSRKTMEVCASGKASPSFMKYCGHLDEYNIVTANVAATSGKSFLKVFFMVPIEIDVKPADIIKFRFNDLDGFLNVASRGERADCKWVGDAPIKMGFLGQEGGIECDGWSYKSILHINWLNR